MAALPTVEIHALKGEKGEKWIINESDFDPKIHTLWSEKPAKAEKEPTPEPPPKRKSKSSDEESE